MEEWKDVIGYEGLYKVSSDGKVKSLNYNHTGKENIMKASKLKGYSYSCISKDKKGRMLSIHRLVAIAFLSNPNNLPYVCHKDETVDENGFLYNGVDNLFWCTARDNSQDMWKKGRANNAFKLNNPSKGKFGKDNTNSVKVKQYTLDGGFIKEWHSMADVERELGIGFPHISECCRGRRKTCGGFIWKYS